MGPWVPRARVGACLDSDTLPGEAVTRRTSRFLAAAREAHRDYVLLAIQLHHDTEISSCHGSDLRTGTQGSGLMVDDAAVEEAVGTRGDQQAAELRTNSTESSKQDSARATMAMAVNETEDHARLPIEERPNQVRFYQGRAYTACQATPPEATTRLI